MSNTYPTIAIEANSMDIFCILKKNIKNPTPKSAAMGKAIWDTLVLEEEILTLLPESRSCLMFDMVNIFDLALKDAKLYIPYI